MSSSQQVRSVPPEEAGGVHCLSVDAHRSISTNHTVHGTMRWQVVDCPSNPQPFVTEGDALAVPGAGIDNHLAAGEYHRARKLAVPERGARGSLYKGVVSTRSSTGGGVIVNNATRLKVPKLLAHHVADGLGDCDEHSVLLLLVPLVDVGEQPLATG